MSKTCKQEKTQDTSGRDEKGRFKKGVSGNPYGNTHTKDLDRLIQALDDRSKRAGYEDFDAVVADRALQHETVLIAVLKKIYPDLIKGEGIGYDIRAQIFAGITTEELKRIAYPARSSNRITKTQSEI